MQCKHTKCYLAFMCRLRKSAQNCTLHKWFLESSDRLPDRQEDESIGAWLERSKEEFPDLFKAAETAAKELVERIREEQ